MSKPSSRFVRAAQLAGRSRSDLRAVSIVASLVIVAIYATLGVALFRDLGGGDYVDCLQRAGNDEQAAQRCADEFTQRVEESFSITVTPTP